MTGSAAVRPAAAIEHTRGPLGPERHSGAVERAEKTCPKCDRTLPLSESYRDRTRQDGRASWCRDCHSASSRASQAKRKAADPEAFRAANRESVRKLRASNPDSLRRNRLIGAARNEALSKR